MKTKSHSLLRTVFIFCGLFFFLLATQNCANRGLGPQGGPVDSIPPRIVRSAPLNGTRFYKGNSIDIAFDEFIQLNNPAENVLFSPPQQHLAEVRARGKKIRIRYQDSLLDNTTYTIDFGNAIQDNHENNPLSNYSFSFSTGPSIDSLEVYGTLIDAQTLTPLSGMTIGLHADLADSALENTVFTRIGKTNDEGEFTVRNVKEGTYRLYALEDMNKDYRYQTGEYMAFYASTVTPYITVRSEIDTIWRDTVIADTVRHLPDSIYTAEYYYYEPSDILLLGFQEDKPSIYLDRVNREKRHLITFAFSGPQPATPTLSAAGNRTTLTDSRQRMNTTRDTMLCWLTDSTAIQTDSLQLLLTYQKTDSQYHFLTQTDTVWAVYRAPLAEKNTRKKKPKKGTEKKTEYLKISSNLSRKAEIEDTLTLRFATPVRTYDIAAFHLEQKQDTLWKPLRMTLQPQDEAMTSLRVLFPSEPNNTYRLTIDSAAMNDIYGLSNTNEQLTWQIKPENEYATLAVVLEETNPQIIVQLLNEKEQPMHEQRAKNGKVKFIHLHPGTYYMRLFYDLNGDGKWTTGDWHDKRQPEPVHYFPKKLTLRANWDFEETFRWKDTPVLEQKPRSLLNNAKSANKKK